MKLQKTFRAADWRQAALNEALRGFSYGENLDALLHEIRHQRPQAAVVLPDPNRAQLVRFLQTVSARVLVSETLYRSDDETEVFMAWYAVTWQDAQIEVALSPSYSSGNVVCFSDDRGALGSFVDALSEFAARPTGRSLRYTRGWENAPDLDAQLGSVHWDDIVLAPDTMTRVREAIEGFFAQREAFHALGFAWRRGVLLVGPPGTGKTMICKAAAASLPDLPFLYVRDLIEDYNKQEAIEQIFKRARAVSPCVLAFEDLDGLINDENRTVFLNELDGFKNNDGLLIIASSNHPEKIDEALLRRPSRFDRVFHIGMPALAERQAFCARLLARSELAARLSADLDVADMSENAAARSEGFTPAYLKEAFVSAALARAQAGAFVLDAQFGDAVLAQIDELRTHLRRTRDPESLASLHSNADAIGFLQRNRR